MNAKLLQKIKWGRREAYRKQLSPGAAATMIFLCYCSNYETGKFELNMDVLDLVDDRYIEEVETAMSGSAEDVMAACDAYLRSTGGSTPWSWAAGFRYGKSRDNSAPAVLSPRRRRAGDFCFGGWVG